MYRATFFEGSYPLNLTIPRKNEKQYIDYWSLYPKFGMLMVLMLMMVATGNLRRCRDHGKTKMDQFVEVYLKRHSEICITREKERTVPF